MSDDFSPFAKVRRRPKAVRLERARIVAARAARRRRYLDEENDPPYGSIYLGTVDDGGAAYAFALGDYPIVTET